jgi:hypothetical protein
MTKSVAESSGVETNPAPRPDVEPKVSEESAALVGSLEEAVADFYKSDEWKDDERSPLFAALVVEQTALFAHIASLEARISQLEADLSSTDFYVRGDAQ